VPVGLLIRRGSVLKAKLRIVKRLGRARAVTKLFIKTRDKLYNIYKKRNKLNSNLNKVRSNIILIIIILLKTISSLN
jgi:hypothetical protein